MGAITFPIRLRRRFLPILILFGVRPGAANVRLDGDWLDVRFGFFRAQTLLVNIARWDITGPYRWWRAIGVRATLGKPDLTFGGSSHGGVRLHFREPVRIAHGGFLDLYITVDDLEGFARLLMARGIPGEDLRTAR